jgi:PAS domain S-box-containing protein
LAIVIAWGIWQFYQVSYGTRFISNSPPNRYGLHFCLILSALLFTGWAATEKIGRSAQENMEDSLTARSRLVAAAINRNLLKELNGSSADLGTGSYEAMKEQLHAIAQGNEDCRFLYLLVRKKSEIIFLADSEPSVSQDCSPAGQVYSDAPPKLVGLFDAPTPVVEGPYTDRWGTWVSGFVPVSKESTGKTKVALGMDINARDWQKKIILQRLGPISITLLVCLLLIAFFVWQQKGREAAAKISVTENRYRSLVEGSPNCVTLCDGQGRFLAINRNGLEALGYQEQDLLGQTFSTVWPTPIQPAAQEAVRKVLNGERMTFQADYTRHDGQTIFWQINLNPIVGVTGQVDQFVGVSLDITDLKRSEAALREAMQSAEAASTAKSQFLANMSHEIRTPMNGIIGMTLLALDTSLSDEQREYIEMANHSAKSLLRLINEILDFSKVEAGKVELETIQFNLKACLADTVYFFSTQADIQKVQLGCETTSEVPENVIGDPGRLRQVLTNLIGNALKFTQRGHIQVHAETAGQTGNQIELHFFVKDTGMGISPEKQQQIFEAFSQADNSTTRKFGGTGLGLTISSKLVEMMGGRIWVESQLDQGSTFHFTVKLELPGEKKACESLATGQTELKPAVPSGPPLQILLTEDNPINQKLTVRILKKWNHQVTVAGNGKEALALWGVQEFDLILMDVQMPEMDGITATKHIRNEEKKTGRHIPIIAMTALALKGDREHCIQAGMDEYVTKPISPEELFEKLEKVRYLPLCG